MLLKIPERGKKDKRNENSMLGGIWRYFGIYRRNYTFFSKENS
jgi:hypothetical protein